MSLLFLEKIVDLSPKVYGIIYASKKQASAKQTFVFCRDNERTACASRRWSAKARVREFWSEQESEPPASAGVGARQCGFVSFGKTAL